MRKLLRKKTSPTEGDEDVDKVREAAKKDFQTTRLQKEREASRPTNRFNAGMGTGGDTERLTPVKKLKSASKKLLRKSRNKATTKMGRKSNKRARKIKY